MTSTRPQTAHQVRPARRDEIERIVDFQCAMAAETEGLTLDRPTVRRGVTALFDEPGRGRYWIGQVARHAAGCMLVLPEWSDWRNGTVLWIHSLFVLPAHRRSGLFRAMYEHLAAMVEADDSLKGLRLYVAHSNTAAQHAYRRLGMRDDHYRLFEWMPGDALPGPPPRN